MNIFIAAVRVYRPSGHYWTLNLKLVAPDIPTAVSQLQTWCYGVRAVTDLNLLIERVGSRTRTGQPDHLPISEPEQIFAVLRPFLFKTQEQLGTPA